MGKKLFESPVSEYLLTIIVQRYADQVGKDIVVSKVGDIGNNYSLDGETTIEDIRQVKKICEDAKYVGHQLSQTSTALG